MLAEAGETVTEIDAGVDGDDGVDELFGALEVAAQPTMDSVASSGIILSAKRIIAVTTCKESA